MRITSTPPKQTFVFLFAACFFFFFHHLPVFVIHPRDGEQQRCMTSRGAPRREEWDTPSVTKTETRASHSTVTSLCLQGLHYLSAREESRCKYIHVLYMTHMMKERGQKAKKWDAGCICSVAVHRQWFQSVAFPSLPYSRGDFNGAHPSLWLHFTCFMVNKSSQDFGGLLST